MGRHVLTKLLNIYISLQNNWTIILCTSDILVSLLPSFDMQQILNAVSAIRLSLLNLVAIQSLEHFANGCRLKKLGALKTVTKTLLNDCVYLVSSGKNLMENKLDKPISEVLGNDCLLVVTSDMTGSNKGRKVYVKF